MKQKKDKKRLLTISANGSRLPLSSKTIVLFSGIDFLLIVLSVEGHRQGCVMRTATGSTIFEQTPYLTRHIFFANSRTGLERAGGQYGIGRAVALLELETPRINNVFFLPRTIS